MNTEDKQSGGACFLSPRQTCVLHQIGQGLANKQIAYNLGIAEATVKMHVSALLRAFQAQNRVQVLLKAKEKGLI